MFPAASWVVKLVKPFSASRSATLLPVASSGLFTVCADKALAISDPPTAGSMSGVMPRNTSVAGNVGSLQMVGILCTKGLKFFSAATKPMAAAIESDPVPSSAMIWSARWSCVVRRDHIESENVALLTFAQALADARRSLTASPAMV